MSPKHPLVEAAIAKGGAAKPSLDSTESQGTTGSGGTGALTAPQAKTMLTQLERGAQSDEARTMVDEIRKGFGLN